MRAVILAGGRGKRLAPFTVAFPKPLIPIGDMPILEIIVRQLQAAGFSHLTLAVGHLADLMTAYFQDGSRWNTVIDYTRELMPLGTAGPLKQLHDLPENFLVMNGDLLTTLNYEKLFEYHLDSGADLTIAAHRRSLSIDFGVVEYDDRNSLTNFREKPALHHDVSMGIYVFKRSVLELLAEGEYCDINILFKRLTEHNRVIKVFPCTDMWLDIGRTEDYARACEIFNSNVADFLPQQLTATTISS